MPDSSASSSQISLAAQYVRDADCVWIGAGAGMGVDSGLPDFRGDTGFWKAYPPFAKLGLSFAEVANPRWFRSDPAQAWGFYGHRRALYQSTEPHAGFRRLLDMVKRLEKPYFVYTSNVDGHFQRAGFASTQIVECHGSLNHLQCVTPCCDRIWQSDQTIEVDSASFRASQPLPQCQSCDELARPNVLMFGDWHWVERRTESQYKRYHAWLERHRGRTCVGIEMGAGCAVPTVRHEAERRCQHLIRVNPRESHGPEGTVSLALGAREAIEQLAYALLS